MRENYWRYKDLFNIAVKGFPRFGIGSIDVTYRCNLRCKHCYFREQGHENEQPVSFWIKKFRELEAQNFPFLICGWLGGEPLLRPEIIEAGREYFKSNIIFTNGTLELPPWPDSTFVVSVHGTADAYSVMTGADEKIYNKVKEHASRPDLKVLLSFCITPLNKHCIESFVDEWRETGISGVTFEFYTPTKSRMDSALTLDWQERDRVLTRIKKLKSEQGAFIYNTPLTLKLMGSSEARKITRRCPFLYYGFSYDPMGRKKDQCTLGSSADCAKCGCILPFYSEILCKQSYLYYEFFYYFFWEIVSFFQGKPAFNIMKGKTSSPPKHYHDNI